jgi:hypothetical protein
VGCALPEIATNSNNIIPDIFFIYFAGGVDTYTKMMNRLPKEQPLKSIENM